MAGDDDDFLDEEDLDAMLNDEGFSTEDFDFKQMVSDIKGNEEENKDTNSFDRYIRNVQFINETLEGSGDRIIRYKDKETCFSGQLYFPFEDSQIVLLIYRLFGDYYDPKEGKLEDFTFEKGKHYEYSDQIDIPIDEEIIRKEKLDFNVIKGYLNVRWLIEPPREYKVSYYGVAPQDDEEANRFYDKLLEDYFSKK